MISVLFYSILHRSQPIHVNNVSHSIILLFVSGCGDGVNDFQPGQRSHMGAGCLGEESDLRLFYGEQAMEQTPDYVVFEAYNRVRSALKLPEVDPPTAGFHIEEYCHSMPIPYKEDIPAEFRLLIERLMVTMR